MMLTRRNASSRPTAPCAADPNIDRNSLMGTEAEGKTIGIVGLGNVGRRIAALCNGLFRMKVLAYDPYLTAAEMAARGGEKVELDDLLRRSDYVSISCPLTKDNRGMIGARQFALMQPHAYFITTARGFIHDDRAGRRIAQQIDRRRRPRRMGDRAAAGPSAAAVRQCAGEPAYRRVTRKHEYGYIAAEQVLARST